LLGDAGSDIVCAVLAAGLSQKQVDLSRAALDALAPGDAEARLRWMLELSVRDLSRLTDDQWSVLQYQLGFIVSRWPWGGRDHFVLTDADPVSARQRRSFRRLLLPQLRALFRALVEEGRHEVHLPRRGAGHWVISRRPSADGRVEAEAHFLGYVWLQLVLLAVRLLDQVGAHRLRPCPTRGCGRIFLASRRQKYCSTAHARDAAWNAYIARQGGTRAKGGWQDVSAQNVPGNVPASTRKPPKTSLRQPSRKEKTRR